jgi:hypothetical protein
MVAVDYNPELAGAYLLGKDENQLRRDLKL